MGGWERVGVQRVLLEVEVVLDLDGLLPNLRRGSRRPSPAATAAAAPVLGEGSAAATAAPHRHRPGIALRHASGLRQP